MSPNQFYLVNMTVISPKLKWVYDDSHDQWVLNGDAVYNTGPLCSESTSHQWISSQMTGYAELRDCLVVSLNMICFSTKSHISGDLWCLYPPPIPRHHSTNKLNLTTTIWDSQVKLLPFCINQHDCWDIAHLRLGEHRKRFEVHPRMNLSKGIISSVFG